MESNQQQQKTKKRYGFFQVSNKVFDAGLTPLEFTVFCYLFSLMGAKEKCWPSKKTICRHCGISYNTATKAIKGLIDKGIITKVETFKEQWNGLRAQSNNQYYLLSMPWEEEPAPTA